MEDQLLLEIKQMPVYLQEQVKDFVDFLNSKLEKEPSKKGNLKATRKAGFLKGTFSMSPDFDEPLEEFKDYI